MSKNKTIKISDDSTIFVAYIKGSKYAVFTSDETSNSIAFLETKSELANHLSMNAAHNYDKSIVYFLENIKFSDKAQRQAHKILNLNKNTVTKKAINS
jgi:hypothetical protein